MQVSHEQGQVRLDYHDNGQGIDPELLPHIFEPFVTNRREQGFSGLGGYIIYNQVVQLLNGKIKCQSNSGNGVHFCIEMPAIYLFSDENSISSGIITEMNEM
jgi:Signal transduction histidine kinase